MSAHRLEWLTGLFKDNQEKTFLVWQEQQFSYGWLLDHISHWQIRLDDSGVPSGAVVSIEGDYSPETIALLIALIERRAIVVPLTASVSAQRTEFRRIAEVQVVIALPEVGGAQITHLQTRPLQNSLLRQLVETGEPGLVLFSSGSTGKSKAALHNLTLLLKKFQTRRYSLITLAF